MGTNSKYNLNSTRGISKERTSEGIVYHAYNFQQNRVVSIGTIKGSVYEKQTAILRSMNSISLSHAEYTELINDQVQVIRFCVPGDGKYSIDIDRFKKLKQEYYHPEYGLQWIINVAYCQRGRSGKRNAILDNPRGGGVGEYVRPQAKQLPLIPFRRGQYD